RGQRVAVPRPGRDQSYPRVGPELSPGVGHVHRRGLVSGGEQANAGVQQHVVEGQDLVAGQREDGLHAVAAQRVDDPFGARGVGVHGMHHSGWVAATSIREGNGKGSISRSLCIASRCGLAAYQAHAGASNRRAPFPAAGWVVNCTQRLVDNDERELTRWLRSYSAWPHLTRPSSRCPRTTGGRTPKLAGDSRRTGTRARPTPSPTSSSCARPTTLKRSAPTRSSKPAGMPARRRSPTSAKPWTASDRTYASSSATTSMRPSTTTTCRRSAFTTARPSMTRLRPRGTERS